MPSARFFSTDYNFFHPAYWFGDIDARPLSLFRIAFGALMLKEAIYHIPLALTFYSDQGLVPRAVLEQTTFAGRFSLMNSLPEAWMAVAFFILWALVALGLLLGYRTRLMTLLNFVLLTSVINRDPVLGTGADLVMNALAFWSIFIPLGRCYSLDARRKPDTPRKVFAFPVRMFQIQVALVYIFTTLIKLQGHSWPNGSALYMALQIKMYTFPMGDWLLANAPYGLLQALTVFTLLVEGGFTLLVFAPLLQPYLRGLGLLLGAALHLGIGLMMAIPNFPLVMLASYLAFFDSRWVTWLETRAQKIMLRTRWPAFLPEYSVANPVPLKQRNGCAALIAEMGRASARGGYKAALAALLVVCMVIVIWGNLLNDDPFAIALNLDPMPPALNNLVLALGLSQSWNLFAPEPLQVEGWHILAGQFADGRVIDLRTGAPPGEIRPMWWLGPWARWPKFEENLMQAGLASPIYAMWGQYACREFSDMTSLQIIQRSRHTSQPGEAFQPYHDQVMWQGDC